LITEESAGAGDPTETGSSDTLEIGLLPSLAHNGHIRERAVGPAMDPKLTSASVRLEL